MSDETDNVEPAAAPTEEPSTTGEIDRLERLVREERSAREEREQALLVHIIGIIDGLGRLERAADREHLDESATRILDRFKLIRRRAENLIEKEGVQKINSLGLPVNPELHHVIDTRIDPESGVDTIVEVEEDGYLFAGGVLRPATVIIAAAETSNAQSTDDGPDAGEED